MSTPEDRRMNAAWARYRGGQPPQDNYEQDAFAEWRQLDAGDRQSAYEERQLPEELYERDESGRSWEAFLADYHRTLADDRADRDRGHPEFAGPEIFGEPDALVLDAATAEQAVGDPPGKPIDRAAYRRLLGPELMARLEAAEAALPDDEVRALDEMTPAELSAESEKLGQRLTPLDGKAAYEAHRLDYQMQMAEQAGDHRLLDDLRVTKQDLEDRQLLPEQWMTRHEKDLPRLFAINERLEGAVQTELAERAGRQTALERSDRAVDAVIDGPTTKPAPDSAGMEM